MGLLKDLSTNIGLEIKDAYFNIGNLSGNQNIIQFTLNAYVDRNAYLEGKASIETRTYSFIPDSSDSALNIFRQIYAYAKEIDDYKDAIDVLEEGQAPIIS